MDHSSNEANVVDFPSSPPQKTQMDHEEDQFAMAVAIINTSVRVLNARLMWIIALAGAIAMWIMASIDPDSLKLWAATGYSLSVLIPVMLFTSKKS